MFAETPERPLDLLRSRSSDAEGRRLAGFLRQDDTYQGSAARRAKVDTARDDLRGAIGLPGPRCCHPGVNRDRGCSCARAGDTAPRHAARSPLAQSGGQHKISSPWTGKVDWSERCRPRERRDRAGPGFESQRAHQSLQGLTALIVRAVLPSFPVAKQMGSSLTVALARRAVPGSSAGLDRIHSYNYHDGTLLRRWRGLGSAEIGPARPSIGS